MEISSTAINVAPADQPTSVHQIAEGLLSAYTIDDGTVHLAGCTLEDRLFLRLGVRQDDESIELYLDADGQEVPSKLVRSLGMTQTVKLNVPPTPPDSARAQVERLLRQGMRLAEQRFPAGSPPKLVTAMALWCKSVEGKLRFTVGENSVDLPFAGWARMLQPPPFVCPYTQTSTFHLAATHDGRITAADRLRRCAQTGRAMLPDDLATCSVTGQEVAVELTAICPASGQRLLGTEMVRCKTCRQPVSPQAIQRDECAACRGLRPVSKADPRMARVLDEYRPLDRWGRWRLSETATVYILTAGGWFRRLLVVADKDTLELKLLATGSLLFSAWRVVDPSQYDYVLRE